MAYTEICREVNHYELLVALSIDARQAKALIFGLIDAMGNIDLRERHLVDEMTLKLRVILDARLAPDNLHLDSAVRHACNRALATDEETVVGVKLAVVERLRALMHVKAVYVGEQNLIGVYRHRERDVVGV